MSKQKYGNYIREECCVDCDYVYDVTKLVGANMQPIPFEICPECGGELELIIGRWKYTERKTWLGKTITNWYGFEKGRNAADKHKKVNQ